MDKLFKKQLNSRQTDANDHQQVIQSRYYQFTPSHHSNFYNLIIIITMLVMYKEQQKYFNSIKTNMMMII